MFLSTVGCFLCNINVSKVSSCGSSTLQPLLPLTCQKARLLNKALFFFIDLLTLPGHDLRVKLLAQKVIVGDMMDELKELDIDTMTDGQLQSKMEAVKRKVHLRTLDLQLEKLHVLSVRPCR